MPVTPVRAVRGAGRNAFSPPTPVAEEPCELQPASLPPPPFTESIRGVSNTTTPTPTLATFTTEGTATYNPEPHRPHHLAQPLLQPRTSPQQRDAAILATGRRTVTRLTTVDEEVVVPPPHSTVLVRLAAPLSDADLPDLPGTFIQSQSLRGGEPVVALPKLPEVPLRSDSTESDMRVSHSPHAMQVLPMPPKGVAWRGCSVSPPSTTSIASESPDAPVVKLLALGQSWRGKEVEVEVPEIEAPVGGEESGENGESSPMSMQSCEGFEVERGVGGVASATEDVRFASRVQLMNEAAAATAILRAAPPPPVGVIAQYGGGRSPGTLVVEQTASLQVSHVSVSRAERTTSHTSTAHCASPTRRPPPPPTAASEATSFPLYSQSMSVPTPILSQSVEHSVGMCVVFFVLVKNNSCEQPAEGRPQMRDFVVDVSLIA